MRLYLYVWPDESSVVAWGVGPPLRIDRPPHGLPSIYEIGLAHPDTPEGVVLSGPTGRLGNIWPIGMHIGGPDVLDFNSRTLGAKS